MAFFTRNRLPILMYHRVSPHQADRLTIPVPRLEEQLALLHESGYHTISFANLATWMESGNPLSSKPIILTFDDAYIDFREYAAPILRRYGMRAIVFVPVAFMGKTNVWDRGNESIMTPDQLKQLNHEGLIDIGIHSFLHRNYTELSLEDMKEDLENCFSTVEYHHIKFLKVMAYPYGGYPKKDRELNRQMKELFAAIGIEFALRIGNRINPLPLRDRYEIKRIDIRGTDSFRTFKIKLAFGRSKLFS